MSRVLILAVLTGLLCCSPLTGAVGGDLSALSVLNEIKDSRRQIAQGRVLLESKMYRRIDGDLAPLNRTTYECFFDGQQCRVDRTIVRVTASGAEAEILHEINVLDQEKSLIHVETPPDGARVIASVIREPAPVQQKEKYSQAVWDVRLLGFCPTPFPLLYVYADPGRIFLTGSATSAVLDAGTNCITVESTYGEQKIFLDSAMDNLPARIEFRSNGGPVGVLKVRLRNWGSGSVSPAYFPAEVTYSMLQDGVVNVLNECRVIEADFTSPLPENTFSLAGLGLEPGHVVRVIPPQIEETMQWSGDELVKYSPPLPAARSADIGSRVALAAASLVLFALGAISLWLRRSHAAAG